MVVRAARAPLRQGREDVLVRMQDACDSEMTLAELSKATRTRIATRVPVLQCQ
jgi:hypothetical protein